MSEEILLKTVVSSGSIRQRYGRLYKKLGEETIEILLDTYKDHSKVEKKLDKLSEQLEAERLTNQELSDELKSLEESQEHETELSDSEEKGETSMSDTFSAVTALSRALESMTAANEAYARENERLLKITNFSEYDEKINNLKAEAQKETEKGQVLQERLSAEKDKSADLELKLEELEEKISNLSDDLKQTTSRKDDLEQLLVQAEEKIATRDTTVASLSSEMSRYKSEAEDLRSRLETQDADSAEAGSADSFDVAGQISEPN